MGGPGSGRHRKIGGNYESFRVDINKMRTVRLPKSIKKQGINSAAYKNWVKKKLGLKGKT